MEPLALISEPTAAASLMHPERGAILERFHEPGSATSVARAMGWPRQRVGYHVRLLEKQGLLEHVEDRKAGNCTERILQASARCYTIAPAALGALAARPDRIADRFSSAYLVARAARIVDDVGRLRELAESDGKKLATMTLETTIAFESPRAQYQFARELEAQVRRLIERFHRPDQESAREFDLTMMAHPRLEPEPDPGAKQ